MVDVKQRQKQINVRLAQLHDGRKNGGDALGVMQIQILPIRLSSCTMMSHWKVLDKRGA